MQTTVKRAAPVPAAWRNDVEKILMSEHEIIHRVCEMSKEIERDFKGTDMVVVSLLSGTVLFLGDLIRHLAIPLRLDFMGVSSYGNGTEAGELVFTKELKLDVRGRSVLIVDDILDTGKTMKRVVEKIHALGPRSIKTCVLLEKEERRIENIKADYVGFTVPDCFVVGYGLDFAERYRNLPFIGVLHPHIYRK
jgi:hypoxanthine phosphoribosyltransferase